MPETNNVAPAVRLAAGEAAERQVSEISGSFSDVMVVTELRGQYPSVPIATDVDYDALIAGDPNPRFLTLPIGKANITSGNKRHYDEAFVIELERQTLALKPVGLMGHLSDAERGTAFPQEAIYWVGAKREGDLLWGKGYVPPGPIRDRIERYKASHKSLATSIDAQAKGAWDESLGAYRMDASTLKLGQIDLAPADRAGIPDLAAVPHMTSEMAQATQALDAQEEPMPEKTKLEVITEMTVDDARLLPTVVRDAVLQAAPVAPEVKQVAELRTLLGLGENADLQQAVREIQTTVGEQQKAAVASRIRELIEDKDKGIKVEALRPLVSELVSARNPKTVAEADTAFREICEMQSVKDTLAATVVATMGPNQRNPVASQNGKASYFPIPQDDGKEAG
jgi:hypothetical protein